MTRPVPLPLALATALHAAAMLALPRLPSLTLADDEDGTPRVGGWLRSDLYFALDATAATDGASLDIRPAAASPQIAEAWRLMSPDSITIAAEALATFAESLPASVPYAAVPTPPSVTRGVTVVASETLRALAHDRQEIRLYATTIRDAQSATFGPAVAIVAPGWRALVRGLPKSHRARINAARLDPARPAVLACAGCGHDGGAYETEAEALQWAPRRRWQRRETDEGTVFYCAPCAKQSARQAEAV